VLYTFDCFECAIQALAPTCAHCQSRVIGHGVGGQGSNLLLRSLRAGVRCRWRA
jgi:hypothetical protein